MPAVSDLRGAAERLSAGATDDDPRRRARDGHRGEQSVVEGDVVALEVGRPVGGPERPEDGEILVGDRAAAGEVGAEVVEFTFEPSHADPEGQTSAAEVMDGRGLLGDEDGVALRQDENRGSQLDGVGHRREVAEDRQGLEEVSVGLGMVRRDQDVIGRPSRVVPELFRTPGDAYEGRAGPERAVVVQVDAKTHSVTPAHLEKVRGEFRHAPDQTRVSRASAHARRAGPAFPRQNRPWRHASTA